MQHLNFRKILLLEKGTVKVRKLKKFEFLRKNVRKFKKVQNLSSTQILFCNRGLVMMSDYEKRRKVMWMREAEIKHARLAMLAAAGWPLRRAITCN